MGNTTKFSKEQTTSAEQMLLKYETIGRKTFPETIRASADLATAMGTDLGTTTNMLGKTLDDLANGSLTRLNSQYKLLDPKEVKHIENMARAGKVTEAQNEVLDKLKEKFGGAAEAAGDTFAGKMEILNHKFDDVKETIGNAIIPALSNMADTLMPLIDKIMPQLSDFLTNTLTPALGDVAKQFGDWVSNIKPEDIKAFFNTLSDGAKSIGDFIVGIGKAATGLADFFSNLGKTIAIDMAQFTSKGQEIVTSLINGIIGFGPKIGTRIMTFIDNAKASLPAPIAAFITSGESIVDTIVSGFKNAPDKMLAVLRTMILDAIHNLSASLRGSGGLGSGLADILDNATKGLTPPTLPTPKLPADTSSTKAGNITLGQMITTDVATGMTANTAATSDAMDGVATTSINAAARKGADAQKTGTTIVQQMGLGVTSGGSNVTQAITKPVDTGIGTLSKMTTQFTDVGQNIIDSIVVGINANPGAIENALSAIISAAIARIRSELQMHSPSKVFAGIGLAIPQGMAEGITAGAHLPSLALAGVASGAVGSATSHVSNMNKTNNNNITNHYNFASPVYRDNESNTERSMQTWRRS